MCFSGLETLIFTLEFANNWVLCLINWVSIPKFLKIIEYWLKTFGYFTQILLLSLALYIVIMNLGAPLYAELREADFSCVFAAIFVPEDTCQRAVCNMKSDWLLRTCFNHVNFDWLTFDSKSCTFQFDKMFISFYHSCLFLAVYKSYIKISKKHLTYGNRLCPGFLPKY